MKSGQQGNTMKKRYVAGIIDFGIAALLQSLLMFVFIMIPLVAGRLDSSEVIGLNIRITGISMLYLLLRDIFGKKSIGKYIQKLTIVDKVSGHEARFAFRLLRNVTWILGPIEVLVLLVSKQRLGDLLAKTNVVEMD